jgi:uncharacterized protein YyaL (SSP411 family)
VSIAGNDNQKCLMDSNIFSARVTLYYSVENIVSIDYVKQDTYRERGSVQSVCWRQYGPQAFRLAKENNLPVFLVSGTTWSSRCFQLDNEAFFEGETAELINDNFVPVRIDRDESPDLDFHLQRAVGVLSQERGWPLLAFLTAEGKFFFGGTYYSKTSMPNRPSFANLLETIVEVWNREQDQVEVAAVSLERALEKKENLRCLDDDLVEDGLAVLLAKYDLENGGFNTPQGKRLWPGALELLLAVAQSGTQDLEYMVEKTLIHMGRGAVFDQIGGGFFRRTHDDMWLVPSFEKLLCDNTEMLRVYLLFYRVSGNSFFAEIASRTIDYLFCELCDLESGGFYASQAADEEYYVWTTEDVMKAVPVDCVKAIGHHFHFQPGVNNIPYRALDSSVIAKKFSQESDFTIEQKIARGKNSLYAYRQRKTCPFIDRRIFTGWNVKAVEAFEMAGRILGRKDCTEFAKISKNRIKDQDQMAIFDQIEDNFGPSRLSQSLNNFKKANIQDLGPSHGSLLHALFMSK